MAMVNQPINNGAGYLLIIENTVPLAEFKISSNDNAAFFITLRYYLKQQLGPTFFKGHIAPFI
jgi:hypothetical protein